MVHSVGKAQVAHWAEREDGARMADGETEWWGLLPSGGVARRREAIVDGERVDCIVKVDEDIDGLGQMWGW